jgi:hypothetical protein
VPLNAAPCGVYGNRRPSKMLNFIIKKIKNIIEEREWKANNDLYLRRLKLNG